MPYFACGSSTSWIVAPAALNAAKASSTPWATSGSSPGPKCSATRPIRRPVSGFSSISVYRGTASVRQVASPGSWPAIVSMRSAQSAAERVIGPIWSRLDAKATRPRRLTRP